MDSMGNKERQNFYLPIEKKKKREGKGRRVACLPRKRRVGSIPLKIGVSNSIINNAKFMNVNFSLTLFPLYMRIRL